MIEPNLVLTEILQRSQPSDWRSYHSQRNPGCLNFWEPVQHSFLGIHPLCVVQWVVGEEEDFRWLYFPGISRIELRHEMEIRGYDGDVGSRTYYWLDVFCINGT